MDQMLEAIEAAESAGDGATSGPALPPKLVCVCVCVRALCVCSCMSVRARVRSRSFCAPA